jgi:hypothetical protein
MYWRTSQQAGILGGTVTSAVSNVAAIAKAALFRPPVFVTGIVPLGA